MGQVEDPRSHINRRHPLPGVLVIAVLAVLAGAAGPTAIARWAQCKAELLTGLLDLPYGIPGKDVLRRVLMLLKPEAFEAAFNAWIARLRNDAVAETGVDRPVISLDGKTARRSHDARNDLGPLHVVTAWAGEYGLALGQQACAEKSDEITAIPEPLKKIDVRGGVVTIDAMGTQKAIADEVIRSKADYVLALKGNQETLHQAVIDYIDEQLEGRSYLMGDAFSVADAYLFTVTNWAKHVGLDISGFKNLAAYTQRVAARPAVQQAMKAEGLLK